MNRLRQLKNAHKIRIKLLEDFLKCSYSNIQRLMAREDVRDEVIDKVYTLYMDYLKNEMDCIETECAKDLKQRSKRGKMK